MAPVNPIPDGYHSVKRLHGDAVRGEEEWKPSSVMEPADQFYSDRNAGVKDPAGNLWWIGTNQEDVPRQELERRAAANMK